MVAYFATSVLAMAIENAVSSSLAAAAAVSRSRLCAGHDIQSMKFVEIATSSASEPRQNAATATETLLG